MNTFHLFAVISLVLSLPLFAQESSSGKLPRGQANQESADQRDSWTKILSDRSKRGTLHDAFQNVRGDSGRWSDESLVQHAPSIKHKPAKLSLDDWFDQMLARKNIQGSAERSGDGHWLLFRTRQLDDNDRVWIAQIERRQNQFTMVVNEAIWQGRYLKTFTYYNVFGVNLGELKPGKYEAELVIKPLTFKQFEGDGRPTNNWPKDERSAESNERRLRVTFDVP
jgi:hypothetical protein